MSHRRRSHRPTACAARRIAPARLFGAALAWCAALAVGLMPAQAEEPVQAFIEALHRRQMYDMVLEYLDSLPNNPLVSEEAKRTIPYERGRALVEQARTLQDIDLRMKQLDQAAEQFQQFAAEQPSHPLSATANIELGNILVERGRTKLEMAKRPSQSAQRNQLHKEAGEHFDTAQQVFEAAEEQFTAELNKFPKAITPDDRDQLQARRDARMNLIRAQLLLATLLYESSKAAEPGSDEAKKRLQAAAEKFQHIYNDYRRMFAGLYARMWQARCYQDLGDTKRALTYYDELLAQPDEPEEFRELKRKTLRLAMMCWLDEKEKRYDRAIEAGTNWLRQARGGEDRTAEGLAIRWLVARAHERRSGEEGREAAQISRDRNDAATHAAEVARFPGDHQKDARAMIARLRDRRQDDEPSTFADARDKGKAALDAMEVATSKLRLAKSKGDDPEKIAEAEQEVATQREDALRYNQLALDLRDDETPIDEVNQVRYFLCYLAYQAGDFYDAAILGEFVARHYPDSAAARPSARLAMAAYLQAYNAASPDQRETETARMVEIARYMAERWPGQTEAEEAWIILGEMAIRAGDFRDAAEYLSNISDESSRRAEADIKAGQALWEAWKIQSRLPSGERPSADELEQTAAEAERLLTRGIGSLREEVAAGDPVDYALLSAELVLVQLYLRTARYDEALDVLARPETGPLALIDAGGPVARRGNIAEETYKAALRSYVGKQQLEQAGEIMAALDRLVESSPDAGARLTRVYLELGHELEDQVAALRTSGKDEELARVLASFESFLEQIAKRGDTAKLSELNWVSDTFMRLGEGLDDGDGTNQRAQGYYLKASGAYEQLLKKLADSSEATPQNTASVKLRLARCQRNLKQYRQALRLLVDVLAQMPKTLDVQREIAETYQAWGAENPEMYNRAIQGRSFTDESGATIQIWGWHQLANVVQRYPEHRDTYFEARYNVARCRYEYARSLQGDEKPAALAQAERDLAVTVRLDPPSQNSPWYARYDALLKEIQSARGQNPPGGLSAVVGPSAGGQRAVR